MDILSHTHYSNLGCDPTGKHYFITHLQFSPMTGEKVKDFSIINRFSPMLSLIRKIQKNQKKIDENFIYLNTLFGRI